MERPDRVRERGSMARTGSGVTARRPLCQYAGSKSSVSVSSKRLHWHTLGSSSRTGRDWTIWGGGTGTVHAGGSWTSGARLRAASDWAGASYGLTFSSVSPPHAAVMTRIVTSALGKAPSGSPVGSVGIYNRNLGDWHNANAYDQLRARHSSVLRHPDHRYGNTPEGSNCSTFSSSYEACLGRCTRNGIIPIRNAQLSLEPATD